MSYYLNAYLFDQSLEQSATQTYMNHTNNGAIIHIQLNQTFINNMRVYTVSNASSTTFKIVQGSFIELPVMRDAVKIVVGLLRINQAQRLRQWKGSL
ncbi:hypothetical protein LSAT2_017270 [Lamellibrachia satsuma]|nr:hypothetical protein LSAT2_017270 [Lamellibrachia satsuma]